MSGEAVGPDLTPPRRFWLVRRHRGAVQGETGVVAEGVVWSSGWVALHWPAHPVVTSSWTSLDDWLAADGRGGWTSLEWIDQDNADWQSEHGDAVCVEYDGGAIWIHQRDVRAKG